MDDGAKSVGERWKVFYFITIMIIAAAIGSAGIVYFEILKPNNSAQENRPAPAEKQEHDNVAFVDQLLDIRFDPELSLQENYTLALQRIRPATFTSVAIEPQNNGYDLAIRLDAAPDIDDPFFMTSVLDDIMKICRRIARSEATKGARALTFFVHAKGSEPVIIMTADAAELRLVTDWSRSKFSIGDFANSMLHVVDVAPHTIRRLQHWCTQELPVYDDVCTFVFSF